MTGPLAIGLAVTLGLWTACSVQLVRVAERAPSPWRIPSLGITWLAVIALGIVAPFLGALGAGDAVGRGWMLACGAAWLVTWAIVSPGLLAARRVRDHTGSRRMALRAGLAFVGCVAGAAGGVAVAVGALALVARAAGLPLDEPLAEQPAGEAGVLLWIVALVAAAAGGAFLGGHSAWRLAGRRLPPDVLEMVLRPAGRSPRV